VIFKELQNNMLNQAFYKVLKFLQDQNPVTDRAYSFVPSYFFIPKRIDIRKIKYFGFCALPLLD